MSQNFAMLAFLLGVLALVGGVTTLLVLTDNVDTFERIVLPIATFVAGLMAGRKTS